MSPRGKRVFPPPRLGSCLNSWHPCPCFLPTCHLGVKKLPWPCLLSCSKATFWLAYNLCAAPRNRWQLPNCFPWGGANVPTSSTVPTSSAQTKKELGSALLAPSLACLVCASHSLPLGLRTYTSWDAPSFQMQHFRYSELILQFKLQLLTCIRIWSL